MKKGYHQTEAGQVALLHATTEGLEIVRGTAGQPIAIQGQAMVTWDLEEYFELAMCPAARAATARIVRGILQGTWSLRTFNWA